MVKSCFADAGINPSAFLTESQVKLSDYPLLHPERNSTPRNRQLEYCSMALAGQYSYSVRSLNLIRNLQPDGVIIAEGQKFPVLVQILVAQSPFFANAFGGDFKESRTKRCVLHDAPANAVKVIIDFMYCKKFTFDPVKETQMILDAWMLAHRFQIDILTDLLAQMALEFLKPEMCAPALSHASLYGGPKHEAGVLNFIARHLVECYESCSTFHELRTEDIAQVLSSTCLIAEEHEKLHAIMKWGNPFSDVEEVELLELLANIQFKRCDLTQLRKIAGEDDLSRKVLLYSIEQLAAAGDSGSVREDSLDWVQFVLPVRKRSRSSSNTEDESETQVADAKCFITFKHWVLSASARFDDSKGDLVLEIRFEHRVRSGSEDSSLHLEDNISQFNFFMSVSTAAENFVQRDCDYSAAFRAESCMFACALSGLSSAHFKKMDQTRLMHLSVAFYCKEKDGYNFYPRRHCAQFFDAPDITQPNPYPFGPATIGTAVLHHPRTYHGTRKRMRLTTYSGASDYSDEYSGYSSF